jgi:hypothetical protein
LMIVKKDIHRKRLKMYFEEAEIVPIVEIRELCLNL